MTKIKKNPNTDSFQTKKPAHSTCEKNIQCADKKFQKYSNYTSYHSLPNNKKNKSNYLNTKKKNLSNIVRKILFAICSLCLVSFLVIVTTTGILPTKFTIIAWAVALLIMGALGFFSVKKSIKKFGNILLVSCESIIIIILCISTYYFSITIGFLNRISPLEYQIEDYYVIVKSDSDIYQLSDLKDKTIATYEDTSDSYNAALNEVLSLSDAEKNIHNDFIDATTAMLDQTDHALLLRGALKDVASEIIPDFTNDNIRIIYTAQIKIQVAETREENIDISAEPFNIFISGIDTYGEISKVARSDVNMIVSVNPKTHKILLTSIPRDYYVQLHGTTGTKDKLTHAGIYGVDMSRQTLEDLFNINIPYYVRVNFSTLVQVIDSIGGIDITPDTTFTAKADKSCYFTSGQTQHIYGNCALAYSRERYAYASGDRHRVQNQQDVLTAIIDKVTSSEVLVSRYSDLLSSIDGSIQTNIPRSQIYKIINAQLNSMPSWNIEKVSVDGNGSMDITYSTGAQLLYVMVPNEDTLANAKSKIQNVLTPEDIDTTDY